MLTVQGEPRPREDMVRVGMGTADIRYRPEFPEWSILAAIKFNDSVISAEQIANLLSTAGFAIGIGEWRPERKGQFGRFTVSSSAEQIGRGLRRERVSRCVSSSMGGGE